MSSVAMTKPILQSADLRQGSQNKKQLYSVSTEGGFVCACEYNLVCRTWLSWYWARWTQNTNVGLRRGYEELDADITSREGNIGSLPHGLMFTQLGSGDIDFGIVRPSNQRNNNPSNTKIPFWVKCFSLQMDVRRAQDEPNLRMLWGVPHHSASFSC